MGFLKIINFLMLAVGPLVKLKSLLSDLLSITQFYIRGLDNDLPVFHTDVHVLMNLASIKSQQGPPYSHCIKNTHTQAYEITSHRASYHILGPVCVPIELSLAQCDVGPVCVPIELSSTQCDAGPVCVPIELSSTHSVMLVQCVSP